MAIATKCTCGNSLTGVCTSSVIECRLLRRTPTNMEKKYPIGGYAPGNYRCKCGTCGGGFIGDKMAYQCEPCALNDKSKFDALSPAEQDELIKRNAELFNQLFK